ELEVVSGVRDLDNVGLTEGDRAPELVRLDRAFPGRAAQQRIELVLESVQTVLVDADESEDRRSEVRRGIVTDAGFLLHDRDAVDRPFAQTVGDFVRDLPLDPRELEMLALARFQNRVDVLELERKRRG